MTVYDLRNQLAQAIAMGAEDNDPVYVEREVRTIEAHYDENGNALEPTDLGTERERAETDHLSLERGGRREVWLR